VPIETYHRGFNCSFVNDTKYQWATTARKGATVHARNFTGLQPRLAMPQVVVQCAVQCALIFQIRSSRKLTLSHEENHSSSAGWTWRCWYLSPYLQFRSHYPPSSTGKSSVAKVVAERLGLLYVDSGSMYRAVTLHCMYVSRVTH
jgi:hypothetical protein